MILDIKSFLTKAYLSGDRTPYILLGAPGIGKTAQSIAFAKDIANKLLKDNIISKPDEFEIKIISLSSIDKFEMSGAPRIVEKSEGQFVLDYVPNDRIVPSQKRAIIILDEITTCLPDVQTAALSMINEKRIGNIQLSDDVMFICIGNNKEDSADFRPLIAPFVSRCTMLKIEPEINSWLNYAQENSINKHVYNFLKETHVGNLIEPVPDKHTPFACPRSWVILSNRLNFNQELIIDNKITELGKEIILGTIGKKKGIAFINYIEDINSLPSVQDFLKNPSLLLNKLKTISNAVNLNHLLTEYAYDNKNNKLKIKQVEEVALFLNNIIKQINEKKIDLNKSLIISLAIYFIKSAPAGGENNPKLISNKIVQELIINESINSALSESKNFMSQNK